MAWAGLLGFPAAARFLGSAHCAGSLIRGASNPLYAACSSAMQRLPRARGQAAASGGLRLHQPGWVRGAAVARWAWKSSGPMGSMVTGSSSARADDRAWPLRPLSHDRGVPPSAARRRTVPIGRFLANGVAECVELAAGGLYREPKPSVPGLPERPGRTSPAERGRQRRICHDAQGHSSTSGMWTWLRRSGFPSPRPGREIPRGSAPVGDGLGARAVALAGHPRGTWPM